MNYERDRAEGMLQRIDDAARRSEDYRRRAVSAGVKPQKAAKKGKGHVWPGIRPHGQGLQHRGARCAPWG